MKEIKYYFHRKYERCDHFKSKLEQLDRWLDLNEEKILESCNPAELISGYVKKSLLLPITEDDTSGMNDIITRMEKMEEQKKR